MRAPLTKLRGGPLPTTSPPSEPTSERKAPSMISHPDWTVLKSPVLWLLGAPLAAVQHKHRTLWLGLFWGGLLVAATLWGLSLVPAVRPDPTTCCHPPNSQPHHRLILGPCNELTLVGQAHPQISPGRCSRLSLLQTILRGTSLALAAAAEVLVLVVGLPRLAAQVAEDEKALDDPSSDPAVNVALHGRLSAAGDRVLLFHTLDVVAFGVALVAYTLAGVGWTLLHTLVALGLLFAWYLWTSPLHGALVSSWIMLPVFLTFLYLHDIMLPIMRYWHCCPDGRAWRCRHRREPCQAMDHVGLPWQWPRNLWVAYGILLGINGLVLALIGARLWHGQRAWEKALDVWLASVAH